MERFERLRPIILILLLGLFIFQLTLIVAAQDDEPEPPTSIEEITEDTEGFVEEVIQSLDALIAPYVIVSLPLVMVLVQLTKGLLPSVPIDWLKRGWSIILFAAFVFFARAGFADQFNSLVPALATILATVTGLTAASAGSSALYEQVKGAPLIGYSRSGDE